MESRTLLSVLVVTNTSDDDPGSLRQTLAIAQSRDTVLFDPGLGGRTITLTSGELLVDHDVTITGPGADRLTISGNLTSRVFEVVGANINISGLTIAGGSAYDGGGILSGAGLTIRDCTFSGNFASDAGGGVFNTGTLTVDNSTFAGNIAPYGGGMLNNGKLRVTDTNLVGNIASDEGGGIFNTGVLNISNCTVAHNLASFNGGGLFSSGMLTLNNSTLANNVAGYAGGALSGFGLMTISDCTIAGNVAGSAGGGIYTGAAISANNTIIAGNTAPFGPDFDAKLISRGHNLIGNTRDGSGFGPTDLLNIYPMLAALQDNGGPTQTIALLPGSPAIDTGDNTNAPAWDQRGPGFPRLVSGTIDIGAFQVQPGPATHLVINVSAVVASYRPFDVTVTAVDAYGHTVANYLGTMTFSSTDTDPGAVLPSDYTFTADDQGVHTFVGGITLVTPGSQTVTATDTAGATIPGSGTVTVNSSPAAPPGGGADRPLILPVATAITPSRSVQQGQDFSSVDLVYASLSEGKTSGLFGWPGGSSRYFLGLKKDFGSVSCL